MKVRVQVGGNGNCVGIGAIGDHNIKDNNILIIFCRIWESWSFLKRFHTARVMSDE